MAQIAIEESVWLYHRAVSKVVTQMLSHPKARLLVLQARKESDPSADIPEIDVVVKVKPGFENLRAQIAMERLGIDGCKSQLPAADKSSDMSVSHELNAGSRN